MRAGPGAPTPTVRLQLPFTAPLWPDSLFGHLAATAVPGVEEWRDGAFHRTLRLPGGPGILTVAPEADHIACRLRLTDPADRPVAVAAARRLLDLDRDPAGVDAVLTADPLLSGHVAAAPGRRVPHSVDGDEMAVRAVLGQQVSTMAARTHAARLVVAHGEVLDEPVGSLTHLFPAATALVQLDPARLRLPHRRRATLVRLVAELATGRIDLGPDTDVARARAQLAALPGVGPWTVETIAMRALADPDAFLAGDLGVRAAAAALGLPTGPRALEARADAWRPWRSYAVQHLWAVGDHAVNRLPGAAPS